MRFSRFQSASACVILAALCGCAGSAGGPTARIVPAVTGTPAALSGPVTYMVASGSSASGSIAQGTSQALIAVMSGAAAASQNFSQDTLTVSASAAQSASVTRRTAARATAQTPRVVHAEAFPADAAALLQALRGHARGVDTRAQAIATRRAASVGATMNVWVQQGGFSSRSYAQVPATLLAQTAHGNIWVQSSIASAVRPYATQVGNDFENAYASDAAHFAQPDYASNAPGMQPQYSTCSSNGSSQGTAPAYIAEPADRRIDVMLVDSSTIGGWGGYFSAANLMTQGALNCLKAGWQSNQAPFIFVSWYSSDAQYDLQEDLVRSTAHELQHLVNFVNHAILAPGAASTSFNGNEDQYLNEGLSMLAQDLAVDRLYGSSGVHFDAADALMRANAYLSNPSAFSLSGFDGIDSSQWGGDGITSQYNCSGGCYGGAYLFARYLRDRFGGDAFTKAIETSGVTGTANLHGVTGENAGELFGDFALALAADSIGISTSDTRFALGTLNITGSYPNQFGSQTTLSGLQTMPLSGTSMTIHAPVGGFAFVSVSGVPAGGMNVQLTDARTAPGFSMLGGLAEH